MKLAAVWTAETTNEVIESARIWVWDKQLSAFAQRIERDSHRRGFYNVEHQVVIGDGARWIWHLVDVIFPRAVQLVDLYHAKEKVWDAAKSVYGLDRTNGHRRRCDCSFQAISKHCRKPYLIIAQPMTSPGMRSATSPAIANGCVTGRSGMTSCACRVGLSRLVVKNAIGARLQYGSMHWSVDGANKIAALRNCILSNRFEDYWYVRTASR